MSFIIQTLLLRYFCTFMQSDISIEEEKRTFHKQAMAYVMKLQEVHERKKFEFVETVSITYPYRLLCWVKMLGRFVANGILVFCGREV